MTWCRAVSLVAAGLLGVGLLAADVAVLVAAVGSDDPHGYAAIFAVLALACLVPPTVFAALTVTRLGRRRPQGYLWAMVTHGWMVVAALLYLWANASSPGGAGRAVAEVLVPGVIVAVGLSALLVAAYGWRDAAPAGS